MDNDMYIQKRINELHPDLSNLVSKLVGYGGNTVNVPYDTMNKRIFFDGMTYNMSSIPYSMDNNCHKNAWNLHLKNNWVLNTGYVLGKDETWYRHSWCINENQEIIETTYGEDTKLYYGIPLIEQEFLEMLLLMGQVHITIGIGILPILFKL